MRSSQSVYRATALEAHILGAIIASVAYGIVIQLSAQCMSVHLKRRHLASGAVYRRLVPFYITGTFLLATEAYIQNTILSIYLLRQLVAHHHRENKPISSSSPIPFLSLPLALPFSVANTDIYMVWRCIKLYSDSPLRLRGLLYALLALVIATSVSQFAFGLMNLYFLGKSVLVPPVLIASATFITNIVISLAIALRIAHRMRNIRNTLGPTHVSVYTKVINIAIESCLLVSLGSGLYVCLAVTTSQYAPVSIQLLPQICAISPLLIILRVERGRDVASHLLSADGISRPLDFSERVPGASNTSNARE